MQRSTSSIFNRKVISHPFSGTGRVGAGLWEYFFLFDFPRRRDRSTQTSRLLRPFMYTVTHAEKSLQAAYHLLAINLHSISSHATHLDADCREESVPHDVTYIETNTMRQQSRDFLAALFLSHWFCRVLCLQTDRQMRTKHRKSAFLIKHRNAFNQRGHTFGGCFRIYAAANYLGKKTASIKNNLPAADKP